MLELERGGVRIAYEARGEGPGLLLTHGFSATSQMWRRQQRALSDRYRVVTWDLRGHGQSDSPEDPAAYAESEAVDDMAAVLDACGIERALVGGLSLGGYLSLGFWLAYPERVRALLLFDTGPGYRDAQARDGWNRMAEERAVRFERDGFAALGAGAEVRISSHRSAGGLAHAARGTLKQFDSRVIDALPHIDVPTLVLVGEKDRLFRKAASYMSAKIPGARSVVLPDAGHAANIDQPAAFERAVREFLDELPAP